MAIKLTDLSKVNIVPLAGTLELTFECGQSVNVPVGGVGKFARRLLDAAAWAQQLSEQQVDAERRLVLVGASGRGR